MAGIDTSGIDWQIEGVNDAGDTVTLTAAPVPRIIPDGVRVVVRIDPAEVTRRNWSHDRPDVRTHAFVQVAPFDTDADKAHAQQGGSGSGFRFGTMESDRTAYAHVQGSDRPDLPGGRFAYCNHTGAYRIGGIMAGELPGKSGDTFRAVMVSASERVRELVPTTAQAAEVRAANYAHTRALEKAAEAAEAAEAAARTLDEARAALKAAQDAEVTA